MPFHSKTGKAGHIFNLAHFTKDEKASLLLFYGEKGTVIKYYVKWKLASNIWKAEKYFGSSSP